MTGEQALAGPMWQVVCPETGWRSVLYGDRAQADWKARAIDVEIARVNGLPAHPHPVVEVHARLESLAVPLATA
jgi:hypothetical protein